MIQGMSYYCDSCPLVRIVLYQYENILKHINVSYITPFLHKYCDHATWIYCPGDIAVPSGTLSKAKVQLAKTSNPLEVTIMLDLHITMFDESSQEIFSIESGMFLITERKY
jgi:hypothetical protein